MAKNDFLSFLIFGPCNRTSQHYGNTFRYFLILFDKEDSEKFSQKCWNALEQGQKNLPKLGVENFFSRFDEIPKIFRPKSD